MHDGADSLCADDGPNEEGDAGRGDKVRFHSEEVTDLLDREPDGGEGAEPEDEEGSEGDGVGAGVGDAVVDGVLGVLEWYIVQERSGEGRTYRTPAVPDAADHEIDTGATDPGLHAVPDAGHGGSVENGP